MDLTCRRPPRRPERNDAIGSCARAERGQRRARRGEAAGRRSSTPSRATSKLALGSGEQPRARPVVCRNGGGRAPTAAVLDYVAHGDSKDRPRRGGFARDRYPSSTAAREKEFGSSTATSTASGTNIRASGQRAHVGKFIRPLGGGAGRRDPAPAHARQDTRDTARASPHRVAPGGDVLSYLFELSRSGRCRADRAAYRQCSGVMSSIPRRKNRKSCRSSSLRAPLIKPRAVPGEGRAGRGKY